MSEFIDREIGWDLGDGFLPEGAGTRFPATYDWDAAAAGLTAEVDELLWGDGARALAGGNVAAAYGPAYLAGSDAALSESYRSGAWTGGYRDLGAGLLTGSLDKGALTRLLEENAASYAVEHPQGPITNETENQ
jgi:hypothetical protein